MRNINKSFKIRKYANFRLYHSLSNARTGIAEHEITIKKTNKIIITEQLRIAFDNNYTVSFVFNLTKIMYNTLIIDINI